MTSGNWETREEKILCECADSVEWCPFEDLSDYLVCGTYEKAETRHGSVILFQWTTKLIEKQAIKCPAVLDMKWAFHLVHSCVVLGVADAAGNLTIYSLVDSSLQPKIKYSLSNENNCKELLALSLDWGPNSNILAVTDSQGYITVLDVLMDRLVVIGKWLSHTQEAWTTNFDVVNPSILYSGGDDCLLNIWDAKNGKKQATCKGHDGGVTAFHSQSSGHLLSGSYDENYRLWDGRNWKTPIISSPSVGGVWRLRLGTAQFSKYYLAACIYGGFQLMEGLSADEKPQSIGLYTAHDSLAYGASWHISGKLIATCSYYDKRLHISCWTLNN